MIEENSVAYNATAYRPLLGAEQSRLELWAELLAAAAVAALAFGRIGAADGLGGNLSGSMRGAVD